MVLVDTSVWVSHFRNGDVELAEMLNDGDVMCHPFIIGELACGHLRRRSEILSLFQFLPMAIQVEHREVLRFIEDHGLMGRGLGYVDVHLSASAMLTGVPIWTLDRQLREVNRMLNISYL